MSIDINNSAVRPWPTHYGMWVNHSFLTIAKRMGHRFVLDIPEDIGNNPKEMREIARLLLALADDLDGSRKPERCYE